MPECLPLQKLGFLHRIHLSPAEIGGHIREMRYIGNSVTLYRNWETCKAIGRHIRELGDIYGNCGTYTGIGKHTGIGRHIQGLEDIGNWET